MKSEEKHFEDSFTLSQLTHLTPSSHILVLRLYLYLWNNVNYCYKAQVKCIWNYYDIFLSDSEVQQKKTLLVNCLNCFDNWTRNGSTSRK